MTKTEIIRQAKHYFGKDRRHIKKLLLSYEFKDTNVRQWKKDIASIVSNPNRIKFGLFDDLILWIKNNETNQINWNWIGDLSWTIEIVLNSGIEKGYDWDKKLALNCNGTARILTVFISDAIPCFTFDSSYITYSKTENYYEFGPLKMLTKDEHKIIRNITNFLKRKGLQFLEQEFTKTKFKGLYSDTNSDGNASLFDVLFTDTNCYTTKTKRFCDKDIIEKNGTKFRWTEIYDNKGKLKERSESRWTTGGDYFKIVLDNKGQILNVDITRKEIEKKKYQEFKLDIVETFKKRLKISDRRKNRS